MNGKGKGNRVHGLLLVIVHNFHIASVAVVPNETQPVLVIDAHAVLTFPIPSKCFEVVSARDCEVLEIRGPMQYGELLERRGPEASWNAPALSGLPQQLRISVLEALDQRV